MLVRLLAAVLLLLGSALIFRALLAIESSARPRARTPEEPAGGRPDLRRAA